MIDLETLDTTPTALILSIGAVMFDKDKIGEVFYQIVALDDFMIKNFTISASTLNWWIKQQEALLEFSKYGENIHSALIGFDAWFKTRNGLEVWGNGAMFDNAILINAYKRCHLELPWSYRNDRCYRTIASSYDKLDVPFLGTRHNAKDDAIYQANYLIELNKKYNLNIL